MNPITNRQETTGANKALAATAKAALWTMPSETPPLHSVSTLTSAPAVDTA
jgi:hypothetical protein